MANIQHNNSKHRDGMVHKPSTSARCGKLVFNTRAQAKHWLKKRKYLNLRAYQCGTCNLWHTTSWSAATTASYRRHNNPQKKAKRAREAQL